MNVIKERQQARLEKIRIIQESISKSENPDYNKLTFMACAEWGISIRTAKELIEIAKYNIQNGR